MKDCILCAAVVVLILVFCRGCGRFAGKSYGQTIQTGEWELGTWLGHPNRN